jgi:hypothetical protein
VLVRVDGDGALVVGQLSHSWLSGQLARSWGNDRFCAAEPYEGIVLGAQQHDIGWALFDRDPLFNAASGLPLNFLELSVEQHLSIWRDAPDRLMSQSAHAALATSLHGRAISELRAHAVTGGAAALQAHIADEYARQSTLQTMLGLSEGEVQRIQRQMWTWDGISLALCNDWLPFAAKTVPAIDGLVDVELHVRADGAVVLDPWPFATDHVEVCCEGRRLDARYPDEQVMRRAFHAASPQRLAFELVPR